MPEDLPLVQADPGCSSACWPTSSTTPCATAATAPRRGHRVGGRRERQAASRRPWPRRDGRAARAAVRAVPAAGRPQHGAGSASGSQSRAASSRRWAAPWSRTDHRGGGLTMRSGLPARRAARMHDQGPRRRRRPRACGGRWPSTCAPAATRSSPPPTARPRSRPPRAQPPDVVVLDLGLPDMDGTDVIRGLRGWSRAPIIVLSARTGQARQGRGARRRRRRLRHQAVRHGRAARPPPRRAAPAPTAPRTRPSSRRRASPSTSPPSRSPTGDGEVVRLTPTEWHLLEMLVRNEGKLVSHASCCKRSGVRRTRRRRTTCASTSPSCAASSSPTLASPPPDHRARHGLPVRPGVGRPSPCRRRAGYWVS